MQVNESTQAVEHPLRRTDDVIERCVREKRERRDGVSSDEEDERQLMKTRS